MFVYLVLPPFGWFVMDDIDDVVDDSAPKKSWTSNLGWGVM